MNEKETEKCIQFLREKKLNEKIEVKIKGKSMQPVIPDNALLEVKIVSPEKLKSGDIIMFFEENRFFVHRMLKRKAKGFLVKGDNAKDFDRLVNEKRILGKVEKINKKKADSVEFQLIKMPLVAFSLATGILSKTIRKAKARL